jgi:hypothetical protein
VGKKTSYAGDAGEGKTWKYNDEMRDRTSTANKEKCGDKRDKQMLQMGKGVAKTSM